MNEEIKIAPETLSEIKLLQSKFQEGIFKFGNLQVEKMELDKINLNFIEKEKQLKEEWASLQNLEKGLLDKIIQTYGEGQLNLADGTFTPTPK